MKSIVVCAGMFFAVSAGAGAPARATLVGQHVSPTVAGAALICEYAGAHAKFEILSQRGACAPYINVQ